MTTDLAPAMGNVGRWYDGFGKSQPLQPNKSKPGEMRATTLADARKLGLYPSVTTIINSVLNKPVLTQWKLAHMLQAALTLPRIDGESLDDYAARVIEDYEKYPTEARDTGAAIHNAISSWLTTGDFRVEPEIWPVMEKFLLWFKAQDFEYEATEKAVISQRYAYAGTLDLVGYWRGKRTYIDFKTCDKEPTQANFYDDWSLQPAAYAMADGADLGTAQLVNVAISRTVPGAIEIKVWGENERHWSRFECLLNYWRLTNNFYLE